MNKKRTILHITTSLHGGGAEAALYRLIIRDNAPDIEHIIISLREKGLYSKRLESAGHRVHHLDMPPGTISLKSMFKLIQLVRHYRPECVQTWMYHANILGGLAAYIAGRHRIYWSIHHATLDSERNKRSTLAIIRLGSFFARFIPRKIIYCSNSSAELHQSIGYPRKKRLTIPNGYEIDKFTPNARINSETKVVLGMVARYDPLKDHTNLFQALKIIDSYNIGFTCLLAGHGMTPENTKLCQNIENLGLMKRIQLLGEQEDIPEIMNSLDIHLLSSSAEAFPNVIAEAMACGTPCVSTDAGDSRTIIDRHGWIAPAKNPEKLAEAIMKAINEKENAPYKWNKRKEECRQHIVQNFTIEKMISAYHKAWTLS